MIPCKRYENEHDLLIPYSDCINFRSIVLIFLWYESEVEVLESRRVFVWFSLMNDGGWADERERSEMTNEGTRSCAFSHNAHQSLVNAFVTSTSLQQITRSIRNTQTSIDLLLHWSSWTNSSFSRLSIMKPHINITLYNSVH